MQFEAPAEHYDRFMGRYVPTLAAALAGAAGVGPGTRVLDVGCGPGGLTRELVARVGAANVAAIDPEPQFAAACGDRNPGVDVRQGVAEDLPWADGEFDAALSSLVLGFMRDADRGVREMARVTRPGGTVAACMWDTATGGMTMLRMFWSAVRQLTPGVEGERRLAGTTEGDIVERFGRAGLYLHSLSAEERERIRQALRAALPDGPFSLDARAWYARGTVPAAAGSEA
jgi:SAM-dependent methyltransferase